MIGEHNVDNIVKYLPDDEYEVCNLLFVFSDIDIILCFLALCNP